MIIYDYLILLNFLLHSIFRSTFLSFLSFLTYLLCTIWYHLFLFGLWNLVWIESSSGGECCAGIPAHFLPRSIHFFLLFHLFYFSDPWYFCGSFYSLLSVRLSFFVALSPCHHRSLRPVIVAVYLIQFLRQFRHFLVSMMRWCWWTGHTANFILTIVIILYWNYWNEQDDATVLGRLICLSSHHRPVPCPSVRAQVSIALLSK